MLRIEVEARFAAPPAAVWGWFANHDDMADWFPVREVVRRRRGFSDPDGVGAVRTLRGFGLVFEERITDFKPDERLEYELLAGAPVRELRGDVLLVPDQDGTRVRWSVRFRPLVPGTGWLVALVLRSALRRGLERLRPLLPHRR